MPAISLHFCCMTDQPEDIILVYLRRLDENMNSVRHDIREVKQRMAPLETQRRSSTAGWRVFTMILLVNLCAWIVSTSASIVLNAVWI